MKRNYRMLFPITLLVACLGALCYQAATSGASQSVSAPMRTVLLTTNALERAGAVQKNPVENSVATVPSVAPKVVTKFSQSTDTTTTTLPTPVDGQMPDTPSQVVTTTECKLVYTQTQMSAVDGGTYTNTMTRGGSCDAMNDEAADLATEPTVTNLSVTEDQEQVTTG